jgi:enoyl-CoA hydratase/carnithine racemase/acyl dehydratase
VTLPDHSTPEAGIGLRVEGRVAVVTIDRPPANAINSAMATRLDRVWDELVERDVVSLVLDSAHDRFFMAGGDIFDYANLDAAGMNALATKYRTLFRKLASLPLISICAVDGLCVGAGAELAVSCDLRVFGPQADFSLAEVKLGGIPAAGGTQALLKILGYPTALDLMVTGRSVDQVEAVRLGLATAADDPTKAALALAQHMATMPVESVRAIKRTLAAGAERGFEHGIAEEASSAEFLVGQPEFRQRVADFIDRSLRRADDQWRQETITMTVTGTVDIDPDHVEEMACVIDRVVDRPDGPSDDVPLSYLSAITPFGDPVLSDLDEKAELPYATTAEDHVTARRALRPGERLLATLTHEGVVARERSSGGRVAFVTFRRDFTATNGDQVASVRWVCALMDEPAGVGSPATDEPVPSPRSRPFDAELAQHWATWTRDFEPIHLDPLTAAAAGLPGPVAHASLVTAVADRLAQHALGRPPRCGFALRHRGGVFFGDSVGMQPTDEGALLMSGRGLVARFALEPQAIRSPSPEGEPS